VIYLQQVYFLLPLELLEVIVMVIKVFLIEHVVDALAEVVKEAGRNLLHFSYSKDN